MKPATGRYIFRTPIKVEGSKYSKFWEQCKRTELSGEYETEWKYDTNGPDSNRIPVYETCTFEEAEEYMKNGYAVLFINHTHDLETRK